MHTHTCIHAYGMWVSSSLFPSIGCPHCVLSECTMLLQAVSRHRWISSPLLQHLEVPSLSRCSAGCVVPRSHLNACSLRGDSSHE